MTSAVESAARRPRMIDLFAGCGGMTAGFVQAGFQPVLAIEQDPFAAATYAANFGHHVAVTDIEERCLGSMPAAEVIIGGPPCQGFSLLGKRDRSDPRNRLWRAYLEVVSRVRPAFFVMENVPQFLSSPEFQLLQDETHHGMLRAYELEPFVVSASQHGVAQRRRRAILIGRPRDMRPVGLPESQPEITLRAAFPAWLDPKPRATRLPDRLATGADGLIIPGPFKTPELHFAPELSPLSARRYAAVPYGGSRLHLPDELSMRCWREAPNSAGDVLGRLRWETPSVTIRTEFFKPEKGRFLHPEEDRAITHAEAAMIQGFSDAYSWFGGAAAIARQIGNAVPPPLAEAIGTHLRRFLV